jgi:uncharacterized protein (TIGR02145 family)
MSLTSISFKSKSLLLGCLLLGFNTCETNRPDESPDYTGQSGQVADVEGYVYNTIGIGTQIWMTENLKTIHFNDNSPIPKITTDTSWGHLRSPGYCWYSDDSTAYRELYGALYNYYVIETGLLCPIGWHVPDKSDWEKLELFLGGNKIAGGKLKDYFTSYWDEPNPCYENSLGFVALPGGQRLNISGRFAEIGETGNWWTSVSENSYQAISISMTHESTGLFKYSTNKSRGCSVRCIKN